MFIKLGVNVKSIKYADFGVSLFNSRAAAMHSG